jgi:hypothetical protein
MGIAANIIVTMGSFPCKYCKDIIWAFAQSQEEVDNMSHEKCKLDAENATPIIAQIQPSSEIQDREEETP